MSKKKTEISAMPYKRYFACLLAMLAMLSFLPAGRAQADSGWSSDFGSFVLNQEYFQTGLSFDPDAYAQITFSLYDLDKDGEPELFVYNGGPSLAQSTVYVFTHESWGVNYAGNVGYRGCRLYYFDDPSYPGVFCTDGNSGVYRTTYYELHSGSITSEDGTDVAENRSDDPIFLSFCSLDEIRSMGWESFALTTFGAPEEASAESSVYEPPAEDGADGLGGQQFAANIFLSNFSEQHAFERAGFDVGSPDLDDLVNFAYLYCKINRHSLISTAQIEESYFYTLSLADANTVFDRHFALTLSEADAARFPEHPDPASRYRSFYDGGIFYFPAADGETYNRFTVVRRMEPYGDGRYLMTFDIYKLAAPADGVDPSYYDLSAGRAENDARLLWQNFGVAVVTPYVNNGTDTYQLVYYRVGTDELPSGNASGASSSAETTADRFASGEGENAASDPVPVPDPNLYPDPVPVPNPDNSLDTADAVQINPVPAENENAAATETAAQEAAAETDRQETAAEALLQEGGDLAVSEIVPRWVTIGLAIPTVALIVLAIILIARKDEPSGKSKKKSPPR